MLVFTRAVNAMMAKHWVELFCLIGEYCLWFKQDHSCTRHAQVCVVLLNLLSVVSSIRDSFWPRQLQECYHESCSVCMVAADWDTCSKPEPVIDFTCAKSAPRQTHTEPISLHSGTSWIVDLACCWAFWLQLWCLLLSEVFMFFVHLLL